MHEVQIKLSFNEYGGGEKYEVKKELRFNVALHKNNILLHFYVAIMGCVLYVFFSVSVFPCMFSAQRLCPRSPVSLCLLQVFLVFPH